MNSFLQTSGVIDVRDNFFLPERRLFDLDSLIPSDGDRKIEFNLMNHGDIPNVLSQAIDYVCEEVKRDYNLAILKDYYPEKDSGAYERHVDPGKFLGEDLFLCTLRGEADFCVWDDQGKKYGLEAIPNRAMLVNPNLEHQVSRPKGFGYRSILFLGKT